MLFRLSIVTEPFKGVFQKSHVLKCTPIASISSSPSTPYRAVGSRCICDRSLSFCPNKLGSSLHGVNEYKWNSFFCNFNYGSRLKNLVNFHQQFRGYAMRLELNEYGLIWRRPEYVPSWKPEKSGDLAAFKEPDKTRPVLAMKSVESDIIKADERVQSLFSLEFSSEEEVLKMAKYEMKRRIQRHALDERSPELRIALMTVEIRYLQKVVAANSRLVRTRVRLQEMIDRRKRKLKHMRRYDYKKFEWLLEELQIIYRPHPRLYKWITRKRSLRQLVRLHCMKLQNEKLEKYRQELETLKEPFLQEKRETMKWIAETERKLGIPVSVEVPEEQTNPTAEVKQIEGGS